MIPGFFMDYWGIPHIKTHLQPLTFGIDISSGTAAIPGDGNNLICMTYTYDLALYLVKALDLDKWPEFSIVVGDQVTYNEILGMAEEFTGELIINVLWSIGERLTIFMSDQARSSRLPTIA